MLQEIVSLVKHANPEARILYVSGIITADGKDHVVDRLAKMNAYTDKLEEAFNQFSFSAADLFDPEYWIGNIPSDQQRQDTEFWIGVLQCGITDIFMSPGWEKSKGASGEHSFAKEHDITVHYDIH